MAKGRKTGGRQQGARNIASVGIKTLLGEVLPDEQLKIRWKRWLAHRDEHIAFESFKLALSYLYGKPAQPVLGEELAPPLKIDISAIPCYRELAE